MSDKLDPSKNGAIENLNKNKYNENNPMDGNFVIAYKNHIERIAKAIETNGVLAIASQSALKMMNPGPIGTGKVLDPTFLFGAPPGISTSKADSVDVNSIPDLDLKRDFLKKESLKQTQINSKFNLYDEENKATENSYVDLDVPDAGADGTTTRTLQNGVTINTVDYSRIFSEASYGIDFGNGAFGHKSFTPKKENRMQNREDRKKKIAAVEEADAFFSAKDVENGFITQEEFNAVGIEDSTNYMPFFLEDLRDPIAERKRIYFRAFFKSLRESISPSWTSESYFGRVDPVGVYMNTSRTISVSFALVAFSQQGFTTIWRKLNNLSKLLYPTFKNGVMVKAPVCRLRIGDVICDSNGNGLPGYINSSLELDYTDSPWEITEWVGENSFAETGKAPQMIICSFSFQVIHERNPKIDENGEFDVTLFRRMGRAAPQTVSDMVFDADEET